MDEKEKKLQNHEDYWKLVNDIDELCNEAIEEGNLCGDDMISALDRVKMSWLVEHVQYRFDLKEKNEKGEN